MKSIEISLYMEQSKHASKSIAMQKVLDTIILFLCDILEN